MERDAKKRTDGLEDSFESTAIIVNYQTAIANFEKNFLHEKPSKIMSSDVRSGVDDDKTGEVTHDVEQISLPLVIGNVARCPKVNV
jgi:hypothetical protein